MTMGSEQTYRLKALVSPFANVQEDLCVLMGLFPDEDHHPVRSRVGLLIRRTAARLFPTYRRRLADDMGVGPVPRQQTYKAVEKRAIS